MKKHFEEIIEERTKWNKKDIENAVNIISNRVCEDVIIEISHTWNKLTTQEKYLLSKIIGGKYNLGLTLALIDGLNEELH